MLLVAAVGLCSTAGHAAPPSNAPADPNGNPDAAYVLGVYPFTSAVKIEKAFTPLAVELGQVVDRTVRLTSAPTFDVFAQRLASAEYDVAFIQPFDYVNFAAPAGYVPLASRQGEVTAWFVVLDGSPVRKAGDLRGKIVGAPAKTSAVTYLGRIALADSGLVPGRDFRFRHFEMLDSCLHALLVQEVDVCLSGPNTTRLFMKRTQAKLRVALETPRIAEVLFVAHRRVPERERAAWKERLITTTLPGLPSDWRDTFFLARDGRYFRAVDDADYDAVRRYARQVGSLP